MRMRLAKLEQALEHIMDLTVPVGYDYGVPDIYKIAKEALDD